MRFEQIYSWLEEHKPKVILEVGTFNGKNAAHMMKTAGAKKYIGFDVWDEGNEELDEAEFNAKGRSNKSDVEKILKAFDVELIQGNTRETLPEYAKGKKPFVDVVLIDGGHSVPTITQDIKNVIPLVKTDGVIFVDDYYLGIDGVGSRDPLGRLNAPYTVLPKADPVTGYKGAMVKLARVNVKDIPIVDRWDIPQEESWSFSPQSQSS